MTDDERLAAFEAYLDRVYRTVCPASMSIFLFALLIGSGPLSALFLAVVLPLVFSSWALLDWARDHPLTG